MVSEFAFEELLKSVQAVVHSFSMEVFGALILPVAFFSLLFYMLAAHGLLFRRNAPAPSFSGITPFVTVQIPTYNELVAIRCAKSCMKMDYPKSRYEIMLGDDSTDKNVSARIDIFAKKNPSVKVIRRGTNMGYKAGNLNNMTRQSRGDIIVIFDSDFIPKRDFLRRIVAPFENDEVACVQAEWSFLNMKQNWTSKFASTVLMVYHKLIARINSMLGVPLLFGSGQAVRKDVLQDLGGWKEGSLTEDVDFSVRVLNAGYKTIYLHNLKVDGEVPFTIKGLKTQQRRWAYGNTRTFIDNWRSIFFGNFSLRQKFMLTFTLLGYVSSFFLLAFLIFGTVSFMTGPESPINIELFLFSTAKNFVVASGFITAGIVVLAKEHKLPYSVQVFFSGLTIGLLVSVSVCSGLLHAITGRPMKWSIIQKTGNSQIKQG